jgi:ATP-dependent Zn protease
LFVFSSGFFGGQIELYDWLKQLNKDIGRCVTMVATKFEDFKDQEACRKEYEDLRDETKIKAEIASIFREVRGLIMVDNSPVSKKRKEKSRERLINHLAAYQNNLNFKLINTQADKELTDKNKSSNKTFSTLFLIIALIIGLSGIFFFWQRKNKKSKSLNRQVVR